MSNDVSLAPKILADWADARGIELEESIRTAMLNISNDAVSRTPIDTGRLRGNWQIGFDRPPSAVLSRTSRATTLDPSEQAKIEQLKLEGITAVYLVNNLEYAEAIEFGLGRQTARYMLTAAVNSAKDEMMSEIAKKVKK